MSNLELSNIENMDDSENSLDDSQSMLSLNKQENSVTNQKAIASMNIDNLNNKTS